jgi:hypothetical protein
LKDVQNYLIWWSSALVFCDPELAISLLTPRFKLSYHCPELNNNKKKLLMVIMMLQKVPTILIQPLKVTDTAKY